MLLVPASNYARSMYGVLNIPQTQLPQNSFEAVFMLKLVQILKLLVIRLIDRCEVMTPVRKMTKAVGFMEYDPQLKREIAVARLIRDFLSESPCLFHSIKRFSEMCCMNRIVALIIKYMGDNCWLCYGQAFCVFKWILFLATK